MKLGGHKVVENSPASGGWLCPCFTALCSWVDENRIYYWRVTVRLLSAQHMEVLNERYSSSFEEVLNWMFKTCQFCYEIQLKIRNEYTADYTEYTKYIYSAYTLATWCTDNSWKRPWCWERLNAKRAVEDKMVRWHHWFKGHGLGWTLGDGELTLGLQQARHAVVRGVAESRTRLSEWTTTWVGWVMVT